MGGRVNRKRPATEARLPRSNPWLVARTPTVRVFLSCLSDPRVVCTVRGAASGPSSASASLAEAEEASHSHVLLEDRAGDLPGGVVSVPRWRSRARLASARPVNGARGGGLTRHSNRVNSPLWRLPLLPW